jgi:hypothetical protein
MTEVNLDEFPRSADPEHPVVRTGKGSAAAKALESAARACKIIKQKEIGSTGLDRDNLPPWKVNPSPYV